MARSKGVMNKKTKEISDLIDQAKLGPLEFHLAILNLDYEALQIESAKKTEFTAAGIEYEVDAITLDHRMDSAKTLMKYRYSQKQAMEVSSAPEGITVHIVDYTKAK